MSKGCIHRAVRRGRVYYGKLFHMRIYAHLITDNLGREATLMRNIYNISVTRLVLLVRRTYSISII